MNEGYIMNRTSSYLDTINLDDQSAAQAIATWRNSIRNVNRRLKNEGSNKRVFLRVRGRLGKNSPYAHFYAKGGYHYRPTSQDILFQHAERVDVYMGFRPCT